MAGQSLGDPPESGRKWKTREEQILRAQGHKCKHTAGFLWRGLQCSLPIRGKNLPKGQHEVFLLKHTTVWHSLNLHVSCSVILTKAFSWCKTKAVHNGPKLVPSYLSYYLFH